MPVYLALNLYRQPTSSTPAQGHIRIVVMFGFIDHRTALFFEENQGEIVLY